MKSFCALVLLASVSASTAFADESLKCYAFYGVTYKSVNQDGTPLNPIETSKLILEQTAPIVNGMASIQIANDQIAYDANYDVLHGNFFRLELKDLTNGQETHFFGSSHALVDDADTCVFLKPGADSRMKIRWDDLESHLGDAIPDSLTISYVTVQCDKVLN